MKKVRSYSKMPKFMNDGKAISLSSLIEKGLNFLITRSKGIMGRNLTLNYYRRITNKEINDALRKMTVGSLEVFRGGGHKM